jgi:membrane carboxypeptidase/penicillin-binding protein
LFLCLIILVVGGIDRDAVIMAIRTVGNAMAWGLAFAALALFCPVTVAIVRFLTKWVPRWFTRIVVICLSVAEIYLLLNLFAGPVCDPVIDARLKALPPRKPRVYYSSHDGQLERVALPVERRISVEEARDSALRVVVPVIEDERFDTRIWGPIDPEALLRAAVRTLIFGRREGGSTILVQAAKLVQGRTRSNWMDKPHQFLIAMRLNQRFPSKDEQMALYLNLIPMPGDHGVAYAAAELFNVSDLRELELKDPRGALVGATLAGMIRRPSDYNPRKDCSESGKVSDANCARPRSRRNLVLQLLAERGLVKNVAGLKEQPLELRPVVFNRNLSFYFRAAQEQRI